MRQGRLNDLLLDDLRDWAHAPGSLTSEPRWVVSNVLGHEKNIEGALAAFQVRQRMLMVDIELTFTSAGIVLMPMFFKKPYGYWPPTESYDLKAPLQGNPFEVLCALSAYDFGRHHPALGTPDWKTLIRDVCSCLYTRLYLMAQESLWLRDWHARQTTSVMASFLLSQTRLCYMRNA